MYRPKSLKITNIISHRESTYIFRKGEAVIIIGDNLDNPMQRGNGSGKSAFIESLALAFTGTSIRDVRTKELITNDQDSGEVDLLLENTATNKDLRIWRKFYSNTKSAECRIWIGEGENSEIKKSDINEYNKFIFEEIGLSKEDFFNFFLITSDNYNPFLKVSDTKKKEIINRFSGADNIDGVFPFIKTDIDALEADKTQLGKDQASWSAKAEVYAGQLTEIENKLDPEEIEELRSKKRVEIEEFKIDKNAGEFTFQEKETELNAAKKAVEDYNFEPIIKAIDEKIAKEKATALPRTEKRTILTQKRAAVKDQFKDRIEEVQKLEKETATQLKEAEDSLKEFEAFESEVSKKLEDVIECPRCQHKFSLRDKEFNVAEAKELLPGIVEDIALLKTQIIELKNTRDKTIPQQKQQINTDVLKAQEDLNKQILAIDEESSKSQTLINTYLADKTKSTQAQQALLKKVSDLQPTFDSAKRTVEQNEIKLQTLTEELNNIGKDDFKAEIDELLKKTEEAIREEDKVKLALEKKEKQIEATKAWETNFKNFKSHVANQSIKNVADYTNLFLQSMGTDLAINIEGYKLLSTGKMKEKIDTSVLRGGFDAGSYGKFSGGERGRVDLCCILALQELINLNCPIGRGLSLLVIDEILDQVDSMGLESIVDSLQSLGKTVCIVSQNEINALKEHTVIMRKENGVTTIIQ